MSATVIDDIDKRARILALVADGLPARSAASIVGVAGRTFTDWQARAHEEPEGKFGVFFDEVAAAEALIERAAVKCIHQAIVGWTEQKVEEEFTPGKEGEPSAVTKRTTINKFDWKAAADFLQRRFPERWASSRDASLDDPDKHVTRFIVEGDNPFLFVGGNLSEKPYDTQKQSLGATVEGHRPSHEGREGPAGEDPGEA